MSRVREVFRFACFYYFYYNAKSVSFQLATLNFKCKIHIKIDLGCLRLMAWRDAGFQLHLYKMKPKSKAAHCVSRHTVHKFSDP